MKSYHPRARWRVRILWVITILSFGMVGSDIAIAAQSPPGCSGNSFNVSIEKSGSIFHVDDTVTYEVFVENPDNGSTCDVTEVTIDGIDPANVSTNLVTNAVYLAGQPRISIGTFNYTILATDTGQIQAAASGQGNLQDIPGFDDFFDINKTVSVIVLRPEINVVKTCTDAVGEGNPIPFQVTVSNPAENQTPLVAVSCIDSKTGDLSVPETMAPGDETTVDGSYTPTPGASSDTNEVTCQGTDSLGLTVNDTAIATCDIDTTPAISLDKTCVDGTIDGGSVITFSGTITNDGDETLNDISCTDVPAADGGVTVTPTTIPVGGNATYSGQYTAPGTGTFTDTVTCTATGGLTQQAVSNNATDTCAVIGNSSLVLDKECVDGTIDGGSVITFSGTITNTGDDPLVNVACTDDPIADNPIVVEPTTIPVDGIATYSGQYTPGVAGEFTDTVTCTAGGELTGTTLSENASATCSVPDPAFTVTKECNPKEIAQGDPITWTISAENTGDVALDITLNDSMAGVVDYTCTNVAPGESCAVEPDPSRPTDGNDVPSIVNTVTATAVITGTTFELEPQTDSDTCNVNPPVELLCRTPGFWGTHACGDNPPIGGPYFGAGADCEKRNSQNLTQQAIDAAGGFEICGQPITNTQVGNSESALEAICNSPGNDDESNQSLILARHLTVMAINCQISGASDDCSGVADLGELFSRCNNLCDPSFVGDPGITFEECGYVDVFNNGYLEGFECNEDIGLYDGWAAPQVPGPAGSSKGCAAATASETNIFYDAP